MKLDLSSPVVMTIINVTPDSFYPGSRTPGADALQRRASEAVEAGTEILDIGAYSSRPGADDVSPGEETDRLRKAMDIIRRDHPFIPVSLDTFRAGVVDRIISEYGSCIINDISAGELDPEIIDVAAEHNVPYIAMHMRGTPQDMLSGVNTSYNNDIIEEVLDYFREKLALFANKGVTDVITDPGFGFAKTTEQNYRLLSGMHRMQELGRPVLAGVSRKRMIYNLLDITPAEALSGTSALHWECLRQGASILRVHDTIEAVQIIKMWQTFRKAQE